MSEILNEIMEEIPVEELLPQRVNPFCVISKQTFGEHNIRDIQTNTSWSSNPYGEDYAVVPDDLVVSILETGGFVDIELNKDGTEVVAFTPLEIPEIPEPAPEPTSEERIAELELQNQMLMECLLEMSEVVYA